MAHGKIGVGRFKDRRALLLFAALTAFSWCATAAPSQADTGTVQITYFGKAGFLATIASGEGVLVLRGKQYPFRLSGAGVGSFGVSANALRGTALHISDPNDLAGNYTAVGGGAAFLSGVSVVRLHNEKGVVLELRGIKLGAEISAALGLITITMK